MYQPVETGNLALRGEMVALRRRMLNMSQADLAGRSAIAQGTLSKIEQGIKDASPDQAARLAEALVCPMSFFQQGEREYGPPMSAHAMFRKKASIGQKIIDQVIAQLNVRIAHARKFLSSVDIEPELPLPLYELDDFEGNPELVADHVRRAWLMPRGPIRSLTDYVERAGCLVIQCDLEEAKIDGVSYRIAGLPPIIFLNRNQPADRMRFSLAHEVGHIVMHSYPSVAMEEEANRFASALLMPALDIGPELKGLTIDKAAYMKPVWRASMASLIYRAADLGCIDRYKADYLWRQMSTRGFRLREPQMLDFEREKTSVINALVEHTVSEMGYTSEELTELLHLHYDELAAMYQLEKGVGLRIVN
jgi:Zn-dependent peptidase ImmA (M78 family)/DNA-binding XRE family transcriptional regulator